MTAEGNCSDQVRVPPLAAWPRAGGLGSKEKHEGELQNLVRDETRGARKGEGRRSVLNKEARFAF